MHFEISTQRPLSPPLPPFTPFLVGNSLGIQNMPVYKTGTQMTTLEVEIHKLISI